MDAAYWMLAAHSMGPAYKCGAICALYTSAIAATFFISQMPPARPNAGCKIAAAPLRKTGANSAFVVSLSPVATGMRVLRATWAICSTASGGTGSSYQSGLYGSMAWANRMAPAVVN